MKDKSNFLTRVLFYIGGIVIIALGVGIAIKSDLGVSPVSSIPYTLDRVAGIETGNATILFNTFLVFVQIALLRKEFKPINFLQVLISFLFGKSITLSNILMGLFPDPANIGISLLMILLSTVVIAVGMFLYVPAGFVPMAPEGTMLAVSKVTGADFTNIKLVFDISFVVISGVTCLIVLKELGSVGIGTLIVAVLVGMEIKVLIKFFGKTRDKILKTGAYAVK